MIKKGWMANLQGSAMFLTGISCKHIVFVLNVCCIPTIRKSTAFFKYFSISISSVPFQVHYFNPVLHMYGANADQLILLLFFFISIGLIPTGSTEYTIYMYIAQRTSQSHRCSAASLLRGSSGWDSNQGPFLRQKNAYYYLATSHPQALPKLRYATPLSDGCADISLALL
jgi:hypothetical protein